MADKKIINEIIRERDENYGELTAALLEELVSCLDAIELVFDGVFNNFKWSDASYDDENEIIIISSIAQYADSIIKVQTPNGEVEISTIGFDGTPIQKEIHIGIPMEMAIRGSVKEIYTFLIEMETRKTSPIFSALNSEEEEIPLDTTDSIFDEMYEEMEKNKTRVLH